MSYAGGAGRAPASAGRAALLLFVGLALVLSALRLVATTAALIAGPGARIEPATTQTWVFAAIWIVGYLAEAVAGWLLWRSRSQPYGQAAVVVLWVTLGLQVLRLLNLLGSRFTAGQVPWSAFGTVVLLDVVVIVGALLAWQVSRPASALLWLLLAWLLTVTALTGADEIARNGLPLT